MIYVADVLFWSALLPAVFWALVLLDRRRSWPADLYLPAISESESGSRDDSRASAAADLVVIVPARNERDVIGDALSSLLEQKEDFARLIYVDDRSDDGTGDAAREIARKHSAERQVDVIEAPEPPRGWTGKLHALEQGLARARELLGKPPVWVLLTDADIRHFPGSIRSLRAIAERQGRDYVSVMARLRAVSAWERLLIPPFVCFFQLLYPFRRVADDRSRVAGGAGGCVLVRHESLERAGGFRAIRSAVIDDVSLARAIKRTGGRLWLGFSAGILSIRGYERVGPIVGMVARTAFEQLRCSAILLFATVAGIALVLISPPLLLALALFVGSPPAAALAAFAWLAETIALLPSVRHHGVHPVWALSLPFASVFYLWATVLSAYRHWRGHGVAWRGRAVHAGEG